MIDEKEAMQFVVKWAKWGLQQVLGAWDYLFQAQVDENSVANFVDELIFGSLQGLIEGDFDLGKIADELGNVDMGDMFKGDL